VISPMPLTLRPTGLRTSGAFAHLADWGVIEDGEEIGRIYQAHAAPPDRAWFWSLYLMGQARDHVTTSGHAAGSTRRRRNFGQASSGSRLGRSGEPPYLIGHVVAFVAPS
jgi:hypothetical protein